MLRDFLMQLNSSDSSQGVWVNPANYEYRIGSYQFPNGGIVDGWIHIGSLAQLAYKFIPSDREVFDAVIDGVMGSHQFNRERLYEAYLYGEIAPGLFQAIETAMEAFQAEVIEVEVDFFVEQTLPELLREEFREE